ncbi:hypothetical protein [Streptomyces sp. B93]|uniref:hypothetical protein n=1 Tax=Streptomyces sp. B93 TaxID=2824875 RepID=UPI001B37710A|nr:hypothetical protein [Streptomyces sp. B93]MBQ1094451.1 hypothetical protein [Streptomyces sp. B93]
MQIRGSALKLTAVSALVVLTLTGFSTGRGHGSSGGDGDSGGGGCSSSGQDHDSSSSVGKHDDDDDDYDGGSGSGGGDASGGSAETPALNAAAVELVSCATPEQPYATVEVTNPNTTDGVFTVSLTFEDATGTGIIAQHQAVDVPALDTATVRIDLGSAEPEAADVDHCEADELAPAVA